MIFRIASAAANGSFIDFDLMNLHHSLLSHYFATMFLNQQKTRCQNVIPVGRNKLSCWCKTTILITCTHDFFPKAARKMLAWDRDAWYSRIRLHCFFSLFSLLRKHLKLYFKLTILCTRNHQKYGKTLHCSTVAAYMPSSVLERCRLCLPLGRHDRWVEQFRWTLTCRTLPSIMSKFIQHRSWSLSVLNNYSTFADLMTTTNELIVSFEKRPRKTNLLCLYMHKRILVSFWDQK